MNSKYTELFNNITPPKTDDELLRDILSRRNEADCAGFPDAPKKRSFRRPVIIAAAAVAAASVGVTAAGASTGWDFTKLFQGFYSQRALDNAGYTDTGIENQIVTADLSAMGTDLYQTADFGFGKVTFTGAVADSSVVIVMYELNINENVLQGFAQDYGLQENKVWCNLDSTPQTVGFNGTVSFGERSDDGYKCTVGFEFHGDQLNEENTLIASFHNLMLFSGTSSREIPLEEPITLKLPLDFINTSHITVEPNVNVRLDNYLYTLEKVVITPLAVRWESRVIKKVGKPDVSDPVICRFKDGTEVLNYSITGSAINGYDLDSYLVLLDKPININDLSSVTIGDYTIDLE